MFCILLWIHAEKCTNNKCADRLLFTEWTHPCKQHTDQEVEHCQTPLGALHVLFRSVPLPGSMSSLLTSASMNEIHLLLNLVSVGSSSRYSFASGFFNSALCLWAVSTLLCAAEVLLCESSTTHPSTTDGHLGYFQLGVMVKSVYEHTSMCLWWT